MKSTTRDLNEILEETSRHKYWNGFSRPDFDECVQWANKVADPAAPEACFRKLRIDDGFTSNFPSAYHSQILLSRARAEDMGYEIDQLYGPLTSPDLKGGRMLVMRPNDTLSDGIANEITSGFFDVENLPPPMLTIALVDAPEFIGNREFIGGRNSIYLRQDFYILSYVPKSFIPMVQEAIDTNAEDCILWLEDEKHFTAQIFKSYGLWTV